MSSSPPFQASDPLKTYNLILRGFDAIGFNEDIFRFETSVARFRILIKVYDSKQSINLIKRLCRENPSERIGVQKNEFKDLKVSCRSEMGTT